MVFSLISFFQGPVQVLETPVPDLELGSNDVIIDIMPEEKDLELGSDDVIIDIIEKDLELGSDDVIIDIKPH